jgi:hypothetical protein
MADTPDLASCAADTLLPTSPFYALHYHFGMLLGVEDFETEQAYHRGKSRLHNAWLHRDGVVWGLNVLLDAEHDEIRVTRGLALDPAGRELHLDEDVCLSVPAWLAALPQDERVRLAGTDGTQPFNAHVLIRHRACLSRQVPALMELCEGSGRDTAYSRVYETVELRLVPDPAPDPAAPPYHRVRLMLGLTAARTESADGAEAAAEDADILSRRDALLAKPRDERLGLALELLRDCAARDTAELKPPQTADGDDWLLFPGPNDAGLVLADLEDLTLASAADGLHLSSGALSFRSRPTLLATRAIQELAAAAFFCCPGPEAPPDDEAPESSGPRADPESVVFDGDTVRFQLDKDLHPDSVTPEAFTVSAFVSGAGWEQYAISEAVFEPTDRSVTLTLDEEIGGDLLRLIAQGTGPRPLLGADLLPLAGAAGDPPASAGHDFVFMQKGS